jgi:HAD superfamily hydrolase (TIGR01549 family)
MIKALIFDFDGVLVSSEGPRFRAIQELLAAHGIKVPDNLQSQTPGRTTQSILEQVLPHTPELVATLLQQFRADYVKNITKFVEPITFTVDFIRDYKGHLPIAIASMASLEAIERLTKHFGIFEKITLIITRDEVIQHKPHPEIYLKTAEKLRVDPEDCMVFEDTALGVSAALDAGMQCSVILNGSNKKEDMNGLQVKAFVSSEIELQKILEETASLT